jgi:anti-sigma-K factor RskA
MQRTEHVEDLIGGYLLGALEDAEGARVAAHLEQCETCTARFIEAREVLAVFPDDLDELAPRAHVKAALLEAAGSSLPTPATANVRDIGVARSHRLSFAQWAPLAAAAAAVIAIVVGLASWALVLDNRLEERDKQLARAEALVSAVTTSGRVLTMEGTDAAPDVHAALIVPSDGDNNVPQPERGTGYHLWLFANDEPVPGGVLTPDGNGNIVTRIDGVDLAQFDRMELDVQPLGSDSPGGTTVLGGALN